MVVTATRKPSAMLIRRYRKCLICDKRIVTEERISIIRESTRSITDNSGTKPTN